MHLFKYNKEFETESGKKLSSIHIAYHTYGTLNQDHSNAIWVFHAFSANSDVKQWWPGIFGKGCLLDPEKYFIICANIPGSPYGSIAPVDMEFPFFTLRDVIKAYMLLAENLGIKRIYMAIGGSIGGNQALEFAFSFKGTIDHLVLIASCAKESSWAIAIHEAQRMALQADQTFGQAGGGREGLKAARAIGMLSYRTPDAYINTQSESEEKLDEFKASSYIQYQGEKFATRFNALSYYFLTKCMDTHDVGRGRGGVSKALSSINIRTLIIGIDTDMMIPTSLQKEMANHMPEAEYEEIHSDFGHDGFLIESQLLTANINNFLKK